MDDTVWQRCSACKKDIRYLAVHWVCSVSTCNRNRTKLVFCSVACWDSHVAILRHRDAWAVEARAPSKAAWAAELAAEAEAGGPVTRQPPVRTIATSAVAPAPRPATGPAAAAPLAPVARPAPVSSGSAPERRVIAPPAPAPAVAGPTGDFEREILIVVSKLKKYIKDRSGMNCSDAVAEGLSDHVRALCDEAIRAAGNDERKTVLDRDVPPLRR